MHQNYVKSAVRSALTKSLHNVEGTCECAASRRAITISSLDFDASEERGRRRLDSTLLWSEEEEEAMAYRESSDLQLSEVSRGARRLTHMVDSLSKDRSLGRSRYIAEDLLTGALDLQESLVMLRKLQEASEMLERRGKQKSGFRVERGKEASGVDAAGFTSSRRRDKLHEPWILGDGSSRNCVEELKEVIRDSLHRHNLLSASSDDEKASSSRSLSFSPSSRFEDERYELKKPPCLDSAVQARPRPPNLIAKLMGLEDISAEAVPPLKKEKEEKRRSFNPVRPNFHMEMPNTFELPLLEQYSDHRQKSLQDIIENMQFKGLLKSGQVQDQRIESCSSDISLPSRYSRNVHEDDGAPPIVIMKPMHLRNREPGDVQKDLLGKAPVKEEIHLIKPAHKKKIYDHEGRLPKKSERKVIKSDKTRVESESLPKVNTLANGIRKQQKKDAVVTCKRTNEGQRLLPNGKKREAKRESNSALVPKAKISSTARTKTDKKPSAAKDISKQSIPQNRSLDYSVKPRSHNSAVSAKEKKTSGAKPVRKSTLIKAVDKKMVEGQAKNSLRERDPKTCISTKSTLPVDKHPEQTDPDPEPCTEDEKILCELMPESSQVEHKCESAETVSCPLPKTSFRKLSSTQDDIKQLFYSSQSFLNLAKELFAIDEQQPLYYETEGDEDHVTKDARLLLDCGKELLVHKRHELELLNHPLSQVLMRKHTGFVSLDQVVEQISNGIVDLIGYFAADVDAAPEDGHHNMLERDLRCKEMLMWRIGWRDLICVEESDQFITEVEEHILSLLVEEIVTDSVS